MGKNVLQVYVNGILQVSGRHYNEIDERTIEFVEPLIGPYSDGLGADFVVIRIATGVYDTHDLTLLKRIEDIEELYEPLLKSNSVDYVYEDDRIVQEVYTGLDYYVVDYVYDDDGNKTKITTTTGTQIIEENFIYSDGRLIHKDTTVTKVMG
jgi:hypothetical protein